MAIKVNGEIIPESAIQYELARLVKFYSEHMSAEQLREQMPILKKKAKEQALGAKLLLMEAESLDISVPDADVLAKLDELVESLGGQERFDALLAKQDVKLETIRDGLLRSCRLDRHIAKITEGTPDPTEAEMEAHFESHQLEYRTSDRAQARHILVRPETDDEAGKSAARAKILEIRQRVDDGADFAEEAAAHSECPSGRSHGGSLGWVSRGTMVPAFDDLLFAMEVGALSDVVETEFGYHIIEKKAHEEGGPSDFDDVRENIRAFLRHAKRGEVISRYVAELKRKADIVE